MFGRNIEKARQFLASAGYPDGTGFPTVTYLYDNKKLKPRDEKYWREHKATPKAYVTLAAGRKLWASRFGSLTSVRLAPQNEDEDLEAAAARYAAALEARLRQEGGGL